MKAKGFYQLLYTFALRMKYFAFSHLNGLHDDNDCKGPTIDWTIKGPTIYWTIKGPNIDWTIKGRNIDWKPFYPVSSYNIFNPQTVEMASPNDHL